MISGRVTLRLAAAAVVLVTTAGCATAPLPTAAVRLPPACASTGAPGLVFSGASSESSVDVFGIMADGSAIDLTGDGLSSSPSFAHDGSKLAFVRATYDAPTAGSAALPSELWLMSASGSNQQRIAALGAVNSPSFSPDDSLLVVVGNSALNGAGSYVYLIDTKTREIRRLTYPSEGANVEWDLDVAWSPDGRNIAFLRDENTPEAYSQLWLMSPDGSDARKVYAPGKYMRDLGWSPTGDVTFAISDTSDPKRSSRTTYAFNLSAMEAKALVKQAVGALFVDAPGSQDVLGSQVVYWDLDSLDGGSPQLVISAVNGNILEQIPVAISARPFGRLSLAPCALAAG